jgi:hypothetical protein
MDELKAAIKAKLECAGIGYESINVFGVIRCNVHVVCTGRDTADKWGHLLAAVFKGAKVSITETRWNAAKNKGTSMRPTMRKGFLIAIAA